MSMPTMHNLGVTVANVVNRETRVAIDTPQQRAFDRKVAEAVVMEWHEALIEYAEAYADRALDQDDFNQVAHWDQVAEWLRGIAEESRAVSDA